MVVLTYCGTLKVCEDVHQDGNLQEPTFNYVLKCCCNIRSTFGFIKENMVLVLQVDFDRDNLLYLKLFRLIDTQECLV